LRVGSRPRFDELHAQDGRPSIPPEHLLRALLLQAFYSIRSERQLMEQLNYNLLFRWSVGLSVDDPVWVATVFSKNRDRLAGWRHCRGIPVGGAEPATS
jgi:transposase